MEVTHNCENINGIYTKEELSKIDIVINMCNKYKFSYKIINTYIMINSVIDEWYFSISGDTYKLFHKNKLYSITKYHYQKKFTNVTGVIDYIKRHDNFMYFPNSNHKIDLVDRKLK
jgi:hypothetical protein